MVILSRRRFGDGGSHQLREPRRNWKCGRSADLPATLVVSRRFSVQVSARRHGVLGRLAKHGTAGSH
jgi:hypothetical protein